MPELDDYSGPFKPDLRLEDFSKKFLIKLIGEYQYAWLHMSEAWYYSVKDECDQETANKCEMRAWIRMAERVMPYYAKIANIQLNTVLDCLKNTQLGLDNNRVDSMFPMSWEIINENHVIMTCHKCRSLEFMERSAPERIIPVCHINEPIMMAKYMVNPKVKVNLLKLPPRQSPDEFPCIWDLSMEE